MRLLGNIIWFLLIGWIAWLAWIISGLLWCITIIGIPFGIQAFKIAGFVVLPFGKEVQTNFDAHPIANIIWLLFFGISMAIGYLVVSLILTITIIGIPFAKQTFKLSKLALLPFGANVT
ncbi:MAG: YccF domain-containing protein [Acholeplasmataceae bacterium]|nr:YccF domain-containing protein [Acholeplasmataceae bacterium]